MTVVVTIKHEYNDEGTWRDIIDVTHVSDNNNIECYYVADGGNLVHVKTERGEESGMFRTKQH